MKKLALFLALCLLVSSIVPAFADNEPVTDEPVVNELAGEQPVDEEPKEEEPVLEEPKEEEPEAADPVIEEPKEEEPEIVEPVIEEPKDEEPKDEEPKDEEPKDEEPKDEEPKEVVPGDEEPKDEEPKEVVPAEGEVAEGGENDEGEGTGDETPVEEPVKEDAEPVEEPTEELDELSQGAPEEFEAMDINGKWTVYAYNGKATSVTLPAEVGGKPVKVLSEACFSTNKSLLNVTLPADIVVNAGAFRDCTSLLSVNMSNVVPEINDQCFMNCTSLLTVSWPQNLTKIGNQAFSGCTSLTGMPQQNSITSIGSDAFYGCTSLAYADFSTNLTEIGQRAFEGCTALKEIVLPDSVKNVGNEAFKECSAATKLKLSSGMTVVNNYTFKGCRSLPEIAIPASITQIGREAFYDCSAASMIRLHKDVVSVGDYAFYGRNSNSVIRWDECQGPDVVYLGKDALGAYGYLLAPINSAAYVYATTHSGIKFISTLVKLFVLRCYHIILARAGAIDSETNVKESEMLYWAKGVVDGSQSGASLVREFMESNEFKNQKNSNTVKVQRLYDAMLDRNGHYSADEIAYWQKYLDVGMTTDFIVNGFSTSNEFKNLCIVYGMKPGSITLARYRDRNYLATAFVSRLYTKVLARDYDETGLEYWCKELITHKSSVSAIAQGFFFSNEYKAKYGADDTTFLKKCYQGYFDRNEDAGGWYYWMVRLQAGWSYKSVLDGFAASAEWKNLCARYGLK